MTTPQRFFREVTNWKPEKNPVKKLYNELFKAGIGRTLAAAVVLGLTAGIISKNPGGKLLAASAYNLAISGLHVLLLGPIVTPIGPTNPRPPVWYIALLALSSAMWIAAFVIMFVVRGEEDDAARHQNEKRRVVGSLQDISSDTLAMLENLSVTAGCFGVVAFLFCLYQWSVVHRLFRTRFKKSEIREGYRKANHLPEPSKEAPEEVA